MRTIAVVLLLVATATPCLAQQAEAEDPSVAWPVLGVTAGLGGAALVFMQAREGRAGNESCVKFDGGCYWMGLGGALLEQAGGAALAAWGWKLGERDRARDLAAGRPVRDLGTRRVVGLVIGGTALAVTFVGAFYGAFGVFGCQDIGEPIDYKCVARKQGTAQYVGLGAASVLLVTAPITAHAFGYEAAGRKERTLAWQLVPAIAPTGAGLSLSGRF